MPPVRALLAVPGFGRLLASSLVARLQSAMMGLALVLFVVGGGGSYAAAGAASACWSVAAGLATPLLSRAVRRSAGRPGGSAPPLSQPLHRVIAREWKGPSGDRVGAEGVCRRDGAPR